MYPEIPHFNLFPDTGSPILPEFAIRRLNIRKWILESFITVWEILCSKTVLAWICASQVERHCLSSFLAATLDRRWMDPRRRRPFHVILAYPFMMVAVAISEFASSERSRPGGAFSLTSSMLFNFSSNKPMAHFLVIVISTAWNGVAGNFNQLSRVCCGRDEMPWW